MYDYFEGSLTTDKKWRKNTTTVKRHR